MRFSGSFGMCRPGSSSRPSDLSPLCRLPCAGMSFHCRLRKLAGSRRGTRCGDAGPDSTVGVFAGHFRRRLHDGRVIGLASIAGAPSAIRLVGATTPPAARHRRPIERSKFDFLDNTWDRACPRIHPVREGGFCSIQRALSGHLHPPRFCTAHRRRHLVALPRCRSY